MEQAMPGQVAGEVYIDLLKKALTASIYDESAWAIVESSKPDTRTLKRPLEFTASLLKDVLIKALRKKSFLVVKENPFDAGAREQGKDWPLVGYTMVGNRRLENVQACLEEILRDNVPGDLLEAGAWRGGTTIFMRALLKAHGVTDRKVWVADSFEGLPSPKHSMDGWDLSRVKYLKVSLEEVKANFAKFGMLDDQVQFLKGWFSDTLPHAPIQKLALLRLDGDLYSSTMDALQSLYHKVSTGGYVIVDDYHSWPSCRQAVTDFLAQNALKPDIQTIDWSGAYWKV